MFVRIRTQPGKTGPIPYAYLVQSTWNPFKKKPSQKVVAALGRLADLPTDGTIEKMIVALDKFASKMGFASLSSGVVISNVADEKLLTEAYDWGLPVVAKHILAKLGLWPTAVGSASAKSQAAFLALVSHRLLPRSDASELATHRWFTQRVFLPGKTGLAKDDFYRTLDRLVVQKDRIESAYFDSNRDLFTAVGLDLVLFDTTSIYYWGDEDNRDPDSLLQHGFSKDKRGDLKQLLVGVLMTGDGVPIAHEVFPGNTADVKAFAHILKIVKDKYQPRYGISRMVLVADRGMVSEENLVALEQSGLEYIVGIRMRSLAKTISAKLLGWITASDIKSGLREPKEDLEQVHSHLFVREFPVSLFTDSEIKDLIADKLKRLDKGGKTTSFDQTKILSAVKKRRFFVCLNPEIQQAQGAKREFFKQVIAKKIAFTPTKEWIVKNGYRKYLDFPDGLHPELDEERLAGEEVFDGKWIVMTNNQALLAASAARYYQSLQTIERGFRDLKSLISIRPVFHFKQERIKAHIFVCFLALVVKWHICKLLDPDSQTSGRRFLDEMANLKAIAVDVKREIYVRTAISTEIQAGLAKLGMKTPPKVVFDPRPKANSISVKGGRPRKDRSNQLSLRLLNMVH